MLNRILKVAHREYLDTARTKTFIISLLMTPVLIGLMVYISHRLNTGASAPQQPPLRTVLVADKTGRLTAEIEELVGQHNDAVPNQQIRIETDGDDAQAAENAKNRLIDGSLDVYIILEEDVIEGSRPVVLYTKGTKTAELNFSNQLQHIVRQAIVKERCKQLSITHQQFSEITRHVPIENIDVGADLQEKLITDTERITSAIVPFFFMFLMFMGIFGMGQHVLTSLLEEKNSRIAEVLLSALSPFELMAGKILGLAAIGLTVIAAWTAAAYGAAKWQNITLLNVPIEIIPYFLVYYILGFVLLTSIFAAIGALCNTHKEAQSLMMPVTFLVILPMMSWFSIAQNPNGTLATALSFIPPITPMVMILRICADPELSAGQIAGSIAVLVAAVPAAMWLAAKIFRTGILMYGKRPGPAEIIRWIRSK